MGGGRHWDNELMLSIATIAVPARCTLLEATCRAAVDGELVVFVTRIAFGGVDFDLPEIVMHSGSHDDTAL